MMSNNRVKEWCQRNKNNKSPKPVKSKCNKIHESISPNADLEGRNHHINYNYSSNPLLLISEQKTHRNHKSNKVNINTMDVIYSHHQKE